MAKFGGIGHWSQQDPDKIWTNVIGGRTFIFTKAFGKSGGFQYRCKCENNALAAAFSSDQNLGPNEVEQSPQFTEFIQKISRTV
jgi:hypothetical protein